MNGGYICQPCDKIFNGEAPYKAHVLSDKHQRKITSLKLEDSLKTIDNYKDLNLDEHIQKYGIGFKCTVCNVSMNDISMVASHVKGQKHMKAISKLGSPETSMELDSNIQKCGTEYICKACNVFMNDVSIVSSHLKGQKHLKMLSKMSSLEGDQDNSFDSVSSVIDSPEGSSKLDRFIEKKGNEYVCKACYIVMDDLTVAMNHAKGPVHLKSTAQMESSGDYKDNVDLFNKASLSLNSSDSSDTSVDASSRPDLNRGLGPYIEKKGLEYVCNACHISMNDKSIISSHLRGQKHLKTIARLSASDLVSESSNGVELEGKLDQTIVKKGLMYVCYVCDATMTDISTATSHVKGQKHLKNISKRNHSASVGDASLQSPDPELSNVDSPKRFRSNEFKLDEFIERCGSEYKCKCCKVVMNDISTAAGHVSGQKHKKTVGVLNGSRSPNDKATALNTSESSLSSSDSYHSVGSPEHVLTSSPSYDSCIEKLGDDFLCRSCNVYMNSDSIVKSHLRGQKHLKNQLQFTHKGSTNTTDDNKITGPKSLDTDDLYLFNDKFSFSVHTVDEVMSDVKVFKRNDPVTF